MLIVYFTSINYEYLVRGESKTKSCDFGHIVKLGQISFFG